MVEREERPARPNRVQFRVEAPDVVIEAILELPVDVAEDQRALIETLGQLSEPLDRPPIVVPIHGWPRIPGAPGRHAQCQRHRRQSCRPHRQFRVDQRKGCRVPAGDGEHQAVV